MRILRMKKIFFYTIFGILSAQHFFAQENKTTLEQDPKFEELLNEKRKIGYSVALKDNYKIQIYSGTSAECKQKLNDFRKEFKDFEGTIFYSSPLYKVYVGPFKTRIEAEKALLEIKEKFPSSLLIKP